MAAESEGDRTTFGCFFFERFYAIGGNLSERKLLSLRQIAGFDLPVGKNQAAGSPGVKPGITDNDGLNHCWSSRLQTLTAMCPAKSAATWSTPNACTLTWSGFMARRSGRPLSHSSRSRSVGDRDSVLSPTGGRKNLGYLHTGRK
jgi:hypothetical protein